MQTLYLSQAALAEIILTSGKISYGEQRSGVLQRIFVVFGKIHIDRLKKVHFSREQWVHL